MHCRILRNLGAGLPDYYEGQVVNVARDVGKALVTSGLAEEITPKPEPKAEPNPEPKKPEPTPEPPKQTRGTKTKLTGD